MKKRAKWLAVVLAAALAVSAVGCGSGKKGGCRGDDAGRIPPTERRRSGQGVSGSSGMPEKIV